MSCYHPLKGFVIGTKPNGKKDIVMSSANVDHIEVYNGKKFHVVSKKLQTPHPSQTKVFTESIQIPCGQCIGCRLDYSKNWATRMMLELETTPNQTACFITLTYDDDNVPMSEYLEHSIGSGELKKSLTLRKRDFQLFMKRLRKHYSDCRIRFYAAGEYGGQTFRPHYHAIIYGLDFSDDREFWKLSGEGFPYWRSPTLEKIWPFGYSSICDVTWNTCAYVARYVTKKATGQNKDFYEEFNIEPEFALMSRKPGIGREYYDQHKDEIYAKGELFFQGLKGGLKMRPPRYFDNLYDVDYPDEMAAIRKHRVDVAEIAQANKLAKTSLHLDELLEVEENSQLDRLKLLKRGDCK